MTRAPGMYVEHSMFPLLGAGVPFDSKLAKNGASVAA